MTADRENDKKSRRRPLKRPAPPGTVATVIVESAPSWRLATPLVELFMTQTGGHLAPIRFKLGRRTIEPMSIAPWHAEPLDRSTPNIIRHLRGDFFCMPFGGNATPFHATRGAPIEKHPVHGEPANNRWKLQSFEESVGGATLRCDLRTRVRTGRVEKTIALRRGHHAVYSRHVISGISGSMPLGHHAMLKFPDPPCSGILSTSTFELGKVWIEPTELPENRGYSMLKPGAEFDSLERVPTVFGHSTDISRYPARRGYEDLLMLVGDASLPFGWSAVVFPSQRFVWFALRDVRVLRSTILWLSNGGRHYAPWNGRHVNVMGIEDVTSFFHPGLAESAAPNALSRRSIPTAVKLDPRRPTVVNYIFGVAEIPAAFDRVASVDWKNGRLTFRAGSGTTAAAPIDIDWLKGGA